MLCLGDRTWPCSECKRRNTAHLCPNETARHEFSKSVRVSQLQDRIAGLESALAFAQSQLSQSSSISTVAHPAVTVRPDDLSSDPTVSHIPHDRQYRRGYGHLRDEHPAINHEDDSFPATLSRTYISKPGAGAPPPSSSWLQDDAYIGQLAWKRGGVSRFLGPTAAIT